MQIKSLVEMRMTWQAGIGEIHHCPSSEQENTWRQGSGYVVGKNDGRVRNRVKSFYVIVISGG